MRAASTGTRSASEVASVFQLAVAPASWYLVVAVVASDCWLDPCGGRGGGLAAAGSEGDTGQDGQCPGESGHAHLLW